MEMTELVEGGTRASRVQLGPIPTIVSPSRFREAAPKFSGLFLGSLRGSSSLHARPTQLWWSIPQEAPLWGFASDKRDTVHDIT